MTDNPNPSVRSRQVSLLLRTLREDLGLSGAEVAKALGMSPSKISRMETGSRGLRVDDGRLCLVDANFSFWQLSMRALCGGLLRRVA